MHQAAGRVGWAEVGAGVGLIEEVQAGEGLLSTFPPQGLASVAAPGVYLSYVRSRP